MIKLMKLLGILFLLFSFNCAHRTIIIERPSPAPPNFPAKNSGQVKASNKHLTNGKKFYNRRKYAKAMQEFKKAVRKYPHNWEGLHRRSIGYFPHMIHRLSR